METKIFEEIGFTQGEIKVYFALLELRESTIGPISKKSGITSAKTYPILDKLKKKGLVSSIIKSGTSFFQILKLDRILDYLDEKEKKIKKEKLEIKKILPSLMAKRKPQERQYATVYETFRGIKTLYDEMLEYQKKYGENFTCFTLGDEYESKEVNLFFKQYDLKREKFGIKMRIIGLESQREFYLKEYGNNPNIKFRFVKQSIPTGVILFGDNVVTLLWKDVPTAFVIHSKQNAEAYKKFYEDTWKLAKS